MKLRTRTVWRSNFWRAVWVLIALLVPSISVADVSLEAVKSDPQIDNQWPSADELVTIVTNGRVSVREILANVAENMNLGLQLAPDVDADVNVHLEDVPLHQALSALLKPNGMDFDVADNVLSVYQQAKVTRWYTFNYPVTEREGRGELQVSAGSEGAVSGGGGGDENQNKSHVTSTSTMSIWPEVMKSLETLVFQGAERLSDNGGSEDEMAISLSDGQGRCLVVNPMASLILVTAEGRRVSQVEQLLNRLEDSLQRQVAIEVRIMEVVLNKDTQTGINWQTITNSEAEGRLKTFDSGDNIAQQFFQFVVDSKHMTGVLEAISTSGNIKNVSTPRITTLNNQKAVVRVVTEDVFYSAQVEPAVIANGVATEPVINYTPNMVPVGVVLDVTPQVGSDDTITLNVHPTISDIIGTAVSPNEDTAPILSIRELDTVGKVQAGQTLVIAGLMSERTQMSRTGVPVLKDLPVLGYLFGKTSDKKYNIELVMLLTPVIMEGEQADEMATATREQFESRIQ